MVLLHRASSKLPRCAARHEAYCLSIRFKIGGPSKPAIAIRHSHTVVDVLMISRLGQCEPPVLVEVYLLLISAMIVPALHVRKL